MINHLIATHRLNLWRGLAFCGHPIYYNAVTNNPTDL